MMEGEKGVPIAVSDHDVMDERRSEKVGQETFIGKAGAVDWFSRRFVNAKHCSAMNADGILWRVLSRDVERIWQCK